jgi:hypothetical protein
VSPPHGIQSSAHADVRALRLANSKAILVRIDNDAIEPEEAVGWFDRRAGRKRAAQFRDECVQLDERFAAMQRGPVRIGTLESLASDGWTVEDAVGLAQLWPQLDRGGLAYMFAFAQRIKAVFYGRGTDIGAWTLTLAEMAPDGQWQFRGLPLTESQQVDGASDGSVQAAVAAMALYIQTAKSDHVGLLAAAAGLTVGDLATLVAASNIDEDRLRMLAADRGIEIA